MRLAIFIALAFGWVLSAIIYLIDLSIKRRIIRQNENMKELCKEIINLNTKLCDRNEMMTEIVRQMLGYTKEEEQNAEDA